MYSTLHYMLITCIYMNTHYCTQVANATRDFCAETRWHIYEKRNMYKCMYCSWFSMSRSIIKIHRMSLLSAGSISLDSTFDVFLLIFCSCHFQIFTRSPPANRQVHNTPAPSVERFFKDFWAVQTSLWLELQCALLSIADWSLSDASDSGLNCNVGRSPLVELKPPFCHITIR